jgi:hypothetical protein
MSAPAMTPLDLLRRAVHVFECLVPLEDAALRARQATANPALLSPALHAVSNEAKRLDALCDASMEELRELCAEVERRRAEFTEVTRSDLVATNLIERLTGVFKECHWVARGLSKCATDMLEIAEIVHRANRTGSDELTFPTASPPPPTQ